MEHEHYLIPPSNSSITYSIIWLDCTHFGSSPTGEFGRDCYIDELLVLDKVVVTFGECMKRCLERS